MLYSNDFGGPFGRWILDRGDKMSGITFPELPAWQFSLREVSTGVYIVTAKHRLGATLEMSGTQPEELLERCKREAMVMNITTK